MKRTAMKRGKPLQAKTPMKRGGPLLRTAWKRKAKRVTAAEKQAYRAVTMAAEHPDGYLVCSRCGRGQTYEQGQRHHLTPRNAGGPTTVSNLAYVCVDCHDVYHHSRRLEPATSEGSRLEVGAGSLAGRSVYPVPVEGSDRE